MGGDFVSVQAGPPRPLRFARRWQRLPQRIGATFAKNLGKKFCCSETPARKKLGETNRKAMALENLLVFFLFPGCITAHYTSRFKRQAKKEKCWIPSGCGRSRIADTWFVRSMWHKGSRQWVFLVSRKWQTLLLWVQVLMTRWYCKVWKTITWYALSDDIQVRRFVSQNKQTLLLWVEVMIRRLNCGM